MDHDQRFKTLIQEFFADFLRLFFADWAARFDLSKSNGWTRNCCPTRPKARGICWIWWRDCERSGTWATRASLIRNNGWR